MSLLWINGTLIDKADAKVSPFDHGFLYGDGVWEHLRVFAGKLFRPADHLKQLFAAAETLGIDIPLSPDELTSAIEATVKANDRTEGYVRVIVTRGPGTIGPDPRKLDPQVIIVAEEYQPFPHELYGHGLHAAVVRVGMDPDDPTHLYLIRTLGRPHVVAAKRQARANGCLEAVILNAVGEVFGCTEGNLFVVKDGVVTSTQSHPPEGVTLLIPELERARKPSVSRPRVGLDEVWAADEVFIAGTGCGIIGIVRLDGKDIGSGTEGPVTRAIRERFHSLTRGNVG